MEDTKKHGEKAIIIGAGPAGLTAAFELLNKTNIIPIIYEMTNDIGGISKTHQYKGNRMDMGGHRFFSKSDRVMQWWIDIMPLQGRPAVDDLILGRHKPLSKDPGAPDPQESDHVMLLRDRLSRIFYLKTFFDYPVTLNFLTIKNLGLPRMMKIGFSYIKARVLPIKEENSLEDFMTNRFGKELYNTFFKDYTEKLWGVPPSMIKPDFGAQRIKDLSVSKVIIHAIKSLFKKSSDISQKNVETSLIEQFLYPKFGPGQLWEEVANKVISMGGKIISNTKVDGVHYEGDKIVSIDVTDTNTGNSENVKGDYFFSTMPIKDLIASFKENVPDNVRKTANGLIYRDFMTVGLLVKKLKIKNETEYKTVKNIVPDLWIYIQEREVKLGRLQIFNNWSPYLVKDLEGTVWMGLEYFCTEGDELWNMKDEDFIKFAIDEIVKIDIIDSTDVVLDGCLVRVPKAYPAYFGEYDNFDYIKNFIDGYDNLFLIGRNGMHRYNNMDHSMLTAMTAVENIIENIKSKDNIWNVNTEEDYHEEN